MSERDLEVFTVVPSNEERIKGAFLKYLKGEIDNLPEDLFNDETRLINIDLSNCQIDQLKENMFNGLDTLCKINFSNNQINEIPENFFKGLTEITHINFSNNYSKTINKNLFSGLSTIDRIDFSYNKIKCLPENLFYIMKSEEEGDNLKAIAGINFSNNQITTIPNDLFKGILSIQGINFSFNQIISLPENLFLDVNTLWDLNFSNNLIKHVPDNLFSTISEAKGINFSDNHIKDFSIDLIDHIRYINDIKFSNNYISSISLQLLSIDNLYIDFRNNFKINNISLLFDKFFSIENSSDKKHFIKKCDSNQLNMNLLSVFLNKKLNKVSELKNDFNERIDKLKAHKWTVLDFLVSLLDFNNFLLIDLENFVDNLLKENANLLENEEFKFASTESLIYLCKRNNIDLLKLFFPIKNCGDKEEDDDYKKYLKFNKDEEEFFKNTNFFKCMRIAIKNKNEEVAMYILEILNRVLTKYPELYYDENISNTSSEPRNEYELEEQKTKSLSSFSSKQDSFKQGLLKILNLIKDTNKTNLLNHKTTSELLDSKWKLLPRFVYYIHLITFLVFILFYSIQIETYKYGYFDDKHKKNLVFASKIICYVITGLLILTEIWQLINSFILKRATLYISSIKNICELVNYPLIAITLSLPIGEAKSVLFSITILLLYFIFITCLDKFYGIGPYINVFGKILKRSLRVIFILLIGMVGFLLSFRNRANADYSDNDMYTNNNMGAFNTSFELAFFKVFTMTVGSVDENMGLENLNKNNFVNYFLYGLFLFMMPILFLNIFTGISIDEVKDLIDRSKAENIIFKINYVYNFELIKSRHTNRRPILCLINGFESFLKFFDDFFEKVKGKKKYENIKQKENDNDEEEELAIEEELSIEGNINNVLLRLDQIGNRFNYLENKLYNQKDETTSRINTIENKLDNLKDDMRQILEFLQKK